MAQSPVHPAAKVDDQKQSFLDEAIEGLENSWQATGGGDIARFVPPPDHVFRERVLVELIKVDQEYRWASGQQRRLEAYLTDWPELADKAHIARELLEAECLTQASFGSPPTVQEIESRFPEISPPIDLEAITAQAEREQDPGQIADGAPAATDTSRSVAEQTPSTPPSPPPLTVGQLFGRDDRYKILELLGQGGMGTVYRAYDTRLGRDVALKIPRVDPTAEPAVLERFVRESRAAAKIRHPNICPIFDADEFEGTFYITMALIEGQSLADWEKGHTVDPQKAAEVVWKLARALAVVHSEGIVHRDIKPSNVMIDRSGEPLLMDFGLARLTQEEQAGEELLKSSEMPQNALDREANQSESVRGPLDNGHLTHTGSLVGTLQYMSPEQTQGKAVDVSSDVYSLGVLLYQVLTSHLPFEGSPAEILKSIRHSEPPRFCSFLPDLDTRLEAICLKAMAKNPAARFQTAGHFADALQRWLRISPDPSGPPRRNHLLRWASAAGAAFVLLGIIIYIRTEQGTAVVRVNDPGAEITIDRDKVSIESPGGINELKNQQRRLLASPDLPKIAPPGHASPQVASDQAEDRRQQPGELLRRQQLAAAITKAKEIVRVYGVGHVVVGRVVLDGPEDPRYVAAQMEILQDGYFAGETNDLVRPIGFRMHQYAPLDVQLNGKSGDVVDIGTVRMSRLPPSQLIAIKGKVVLQGQNDPLAASVQLSVSKGPINTPHNGTSPRSFWPPPIIVSVGKDGNISASGFSPIEYWCVVEAPGYITKSFSVTVAPPGPFDLGVIMLERPRRIALTYVVAQERPFDMQNKHQTVVSGGDRWKATPDIYGWDIEFSQDGDDILLNYSYVPCYLADLGKGKLEDFVDTANTKTLDDELRGLKIQSGHVYLVHQQHWHRWLFFRVDIPSPMGAASLETSTKGATLERFQRALGTRWDKLSLIDKKKIELEWHKWSENERTAIYRIYAAPEEVLASLSPEERKAVFQQKAPTPEDVEWIKSSCPWINLNDLSQSDRLLLVWREMMIAAFEAWRSNQGR